MSIPFEMPYGTEAQIGAEVLESGYQNMPVWSTDGHRIWVLDGSGKYKVAMSGDLSDFVSSTDLTNALKGKADTSHTHEISNVNGLQAALNGKQPSGSYAASEHTHQIADVENLQTALDGKAGSSHSHTIADVTELQTTLDGKIPKTGSAGTLKTTETIATASTVNASSARSMSLASGGSLTVSNGAAGQAWITVVALAGSATITLGSNWAWSGSSPDLAKGLVTLAWYGTFGVANFTKYGE